MGLFLHAVDSVSPADPAAERILLRCEGIKNRSYICESGHCCGESQCCSYYYELWWFWLVWGIIFILSCCCVCHHRRTKHRLQHQQRQHEINLIAYREAHSYTSVPFYFRFLPNYLLPDYEEVVNRPPTPPPPYSALHTGPTSVVSSPLTPEQQEGRCPTSQPTPEPPVSDSPEEALPPTLNIMPNIDSKLTQTVPDSSEIRLPDGLDREGLTSQEKKGGRRDDFCKDPLPKDLSEGGAYDRDQLPDGRRRRFTGDSGIEVCVCGSSGFSGAGGKSEEGRDYRELERLLRHEGHDGDEEVGDVCDGCGQRASPGVEEEHAPAPGGLDRRAIHGLSGPPQPAHQKANGSLDPPACLLLHTIDEHEGPHHSASTEPQG
ncbi:WW domain binding protein 1-like b [Brachionichthys hirsutus]|uniref:WW domain binding protein 1-like b n=1 Tax=Brachionichthys hirsutus TaxID=412623 RepID=UPI003604DB87